MYILSLDVRARHQVSGSSQAKTRRMANVWSVAWTRDKRITVDSWRYSVLG